MCVVSTVSFQITKITCNYSEVIGYEIKQTFNTLGVLGNQNVLLLGLENFTRGRRGTKSPMEFLNSVLFMARQHAHAMRYSLIV